MVGNDNDAEIRAALIAAARAQIGRDDSSHFNIRGLCEEAGISKAEFRRFFPGREALIAAVLNEDVAQLQEIADANAEPRATLAVANGAPVSASAPASPPPDAWLERRLRVFERALAGLESRQEKTEQLLNRSVALLEEKITRPIEKPALQVAVPVLVPAPAPEPVMEPQPAKAEAPAPVARMTPMPALEVEPPVTQKEMEDLLANARRVAREAAVEPLAPRSRRVPRWMAWTAVGCIAMMALTALIIANIAGASSARGDSVSHRQIAGLSLAQVAALAGRGDMRSQTLLAFAYFEGRHGASDPATALKWGLAAAKQGVPMAQYLVGTLYQDGSGVAPDPHQAFGWFEASALRGNVKAMHDLAIAYAEGQGTAHDASRAAAWFNRAAGQGYVDSQFDLAVLYERGDGVRQNPQAALKWYLIAANAGDAQARARASQLASEMKPSDVARVKTLAAGFMPMERDPIANTL